MKLSDTWFIEGYIDFELQKYKLLAYLKEVNSYFNTNKLYPQLGDVIFHYNNLVSFRENKKLIQDNFPKELDSINTQKLELLYKQMLNDDETMHELERIVTYAADELKSTIHNGTEIYDMIESRIKIEPVGILPIYKDEGYALLTCNPGSEIKAYYYTVKLFEHYNARYKAIQVNYIDSWTHSFINTFAQIKKELLRTYKALPNPAVYSIESGFQIPFTETYLPIAKRMLVKHITLGEA